MQEILLRFEDAAKDLNSWTLAVPGLACVALGLFLWLGGVRYSSVIMGLLGGGAGAFIGLVLSRWLGISLPIGVIGGAVIVALIAVLLQKIAIIVLAAVIFALISGTFYFNYSLAGEKAQEILARIKEKAQTLPPPTNKTELHQTAKEKLSRIGSEIRQSASSNRFMLLLWILAGAVVGLLLVYILKTLIMSLCYSIVGSTAVVSGVLMVVLAKGTLVITALSHRPRVLPTILIAMVIFGWVVQLLLGKPGKKKAPVQPE